jgi:hypothetical protein
MNPEQHMQAVMAETARAFAEHSMLDPQHEFGLLALSPCFLLDYRSDRWVAHHWTGKQKHVRRQPIPEGVDLRRVSGAVMSNDLSLNLALWFVGRRPNTNRLSIKMFAVAENTGVLATPDAWATRQIAFYAADLSGDGPDTASDAASGRGGWLRKRVGRNSTEGLNE